MQGCQASGARANPGIFGLRQPHFQHNIHTLIAPENRDKIASTANIKLN